MRSSAQIDRYIYSTKAIGKGSFSKVYKGLDTSNDEIIAIKLIDKSHFKDDLVERLKSEIILMKKLTHENIAKLKNFLEDEDSFYIVLEYCAGGDLVQHIKRGCIKEPTAKDYMIQLSSALRYLKSHNIIHRDLKPQNILLSLDKTKIKITDFNFARELYDNDLAQTLCGSPLYMAPEIIKRHEYTVKTDLWSVGLILYEMVYGINPYYDALDTVDLLQKIETRQIQYTNQISPDCNSLLVGLLQKNPENRFTWPEFFKHKWLNIDEPAYIPSDTKHIWESISQSSLRKSHKQDIPTTSKNKFNVDIVDNYIPLGITPPKYSQSEPIEIFKVKAGKKATDSQNGKWFQPRSAPERTVTDHIWSYMTSSVGVLKGVVDYVKGATNI